MHPLDCPRLKLSVANEKIKILDATIMAYISDTNIHGFSIHSDTETGDRVLTARVSEPPDPKWGVEIGIIAHLLRSSLDNLAWVIADPAERVDEDSAYPIRLHPINEPEGFGLSIKKKGKNKGKIGGPLAGLSDSHRAMIERTQPHYSGNGKTSDPLWHLARLNITDKHRAITIVRMAIAYTSTKATIEDNVLKRVRIDSHSGVPFEDGAELARIRRNDLEMYPKIKGYICFGNACQEVIGLPVLDTLEDMYTRVSGIIEMFAIEFRSTTSHGAPL